MDLYQPYAEAHVNSLYNLIFCDDPELYRNQNSVEIEPWRTLLSNEPDPVALRTIANDQEQESRIRALAFLRLRYSGFSVPSKVLLGTIVEIRLEQGLDVLAAFSDGRVRYLNQTGKVAIFESSPPNIATTAKLLVADSQPLVNQIGPWKKNRLPPPQTGNARMSFLVSDGLYFGEGPFTILQNDLMGGPVLARAIDLLRLVADANPSIQNNRA